MGRAFIKATTFLAGGTAAGQLAVVAVSPIVSRLYPDPHMWGTLATFATILSCIAPIVCLRYETAISVPGEEEKADHLLVASLVSAVAVALVTLAFVAVGGSWLARVFKNPDLPPFLWLLPVSLLGLGFYTAFSYWAIRHRNFGQVARTRVAQGVVQAGCQVVLGFMRAGTVGLVLGDVLGRVAGGGTIAIAAGRHRLRVDRTRARATAKEYSSFPLVSGPASLLHNFTTTFPLLLGPMYGSAALGVYFFGVRNVWSPIALIAQAMAQVYLGEASKWAREDPVHLLRSFDNIVKKLLLIGLVPFGALAWLGGPIVGLVFGEFREETGALVQIQALSWYVMFAVGPVLNTLNILRRQSWQLIADAGALIAMGAVFVACLRVGWPMQTAVALYSVCMIGLYIALYLLCRAAVVKLVQGQAEPNSRS